MTAQPLVTDLDPFDLPEWLGDSEVDWRASSPIRERSRVTGELSEVPGTGSAPSAHSPSRPSESLPCDLLAADQAFPQPVLADDWRRRVHQAWTHGQVQTLEYDGRLTLAVPGRSFTSDLVLEAVSRLAKAVGASPSQFVVTLRL